MFCFQIIEIEKKKKLCNPAFEFIREGDYLLRYVYGQDNALSSR